jgi:flagellar basal body L-ring protein FlgH
MDVVTKTLANGMLTIRGEKRIGEHNKERTGT